MPTINQIYSALYAKVDSLDIEIKKLVSLDCIDTDNGTDGDWRRPCYCPTVPGGRCHGRRHHYRSGDMEGRGS